MKKRKDLSIPQIMRPYREEIDALDIELLKLLGRRFEIMREVGDLKLKHGIPAYLVDRVDEVRENAIRNGAKYGINKKFLWAMWSFLIYQSCSTEEEVKEMRLRQRASKKRTTQKTRAKKAAPKKTAPKKAASKKRASQKTATKKITRKKKK